MRTYEQREELAHRITNLAVEAKHSDPLIGCLLAGVALQACGDEAGIVRMVNAMNDFALAEIQRARR